MKTTTKKATFAKNEKLANVATETGNATKPETVSNIPQTDVKSKFDYKSFTEYLKRVSPETETEKTETIPCKSEIPFADTINGYRNVNSVVPFINPEEVEIIETEKTGKRLTQKEIDKLYTKEIDSVLHDGVIDSKLSGFAGCKKHVVNMFSCVDCGRKANFGLHPTITITTMQRFKKLETVKIKDGIDVNRLRGYKTTFSNGLRLSVNRIGKKQAKATFRYSIPENNAFYNEMPEMLAHYCYSIAYRIVARALLTVYQNSGDVRIFRLLCDCIKDGKNVYSVHFANDVQTVVKRSTKHKGTDGLYHENSPDYGGYSGYINQKIVYDSGKENDYYMIDSELLNGKKVVHDTFTNADIDDFIQVVILACCELYNAGQITCFSDVKLQKGTLFHAVNSRIYEYRINNAQLDATFNQNSFGKIPYDEIFKTETDTVKYRDDYRFFYNETVNAIEREIAPFFTGKAKNSFPDAVKAWRLKTEKGFTLEQIAKELNYSRVPTVHAMIARVQTAIDTIAVNRLCEIGIL